MWASAETVMMNHKGLALQSSSKHIEKERKKDTSRKISRPCLQLWPNLSTFRPHSLYSMDPDKGFPGSLERKKIKNKIFSQVHVGGKKKIKWKFHEFKDFFFHIFKVVLYRYTQGAGNH